MGEEGAVPSLVEAIKGTLSVGNLNINNKLNKIVLLIIMTTCQESGDSQAVIKHSSLPRQTAPTDRHCTSYTPAHAESTAPRWAHQGPMFISSVPITTSSPS